jgi:hypothetical protein
MKAESWEIPFSGKCDVMRVQNSPLFELALVLVRFDHIASHIRSAAKLETLSQQPKITLQQRSL